MVERTPSRRPFAPEATSDASGRFLLRLDPGLHAALREAARAHDVSLNEYCAQKLTAPLGSLATLAVATTTVRRAAALAGEDLLAVIAFGSWARGEEGESSDLDVLIVVADGVALNRELYRRWDLESSREVDLDARGDGRSVDPHFAHLPDPDTASPGLWGEVAIDGIVLFERDLTLSRRLAEIRRRIAEGRLVRRFAHGQPYWLDLRENTAAPPAGEPAGK
jgi:predicted nucleotidyltransferase